MRRSLIAANWKMNGRKDGIGVLIQSILAHTEARSYDLVICPPSLYMSQVQQQLVGTSVVLGAQNVFTCDSGAFTGEISAAMLRDFVCPYVIVGHSERRELFAESDAQAAEKFSVVQAQGLIPIFCVGETLKQHEAGRTEAVILRQLDAVLSGKDVQVLRQAVVAYEPVWAIGTGLTARPEQAQQVHAMIRARVAELDKSVADGLRIIYGGSVKAENAASLFLEPDIDGVLVGGASLIADEFISICKSLQQQIPGLAKTGNE
ncbi:MAG: triose-phosphate isomerase [Pseudomonadales bacterium]|nr:triose-phosphate isomerase [Pseudomonadales bacterium]